MIEYPSRQPQVSSDLFSSNTFLDFVGKNRVQELSLEKLKRTNHEMNGYTKMPQNGVFHDEFIHKVLSIAERCEYQPEITGLFAAQNQERKLPGVSIISELERRYGQKAVEVQSGDTPETLQRRVMEQAEWIILPKAAELVAANLAKEREHGQNV